MGNFGWRIEIGKKPRGLWRPSLNIRVFADVNSNLLNIVPSYEFPVFRYEDVDYAQCENCKSFSRHDCPPRQKTEYLIPTQFKFYTNSSSRTQDFYPKNHNCYRYFQLPRISNVFENRYNVEMFLEWRPGKPDYSDYVEWLAENVLNPCIAEFERRWAEAMESEEIEPIEFTSDHYSFQKATEQQKTTLTRKVRV